MDVEASGLGKASALLQPVNWKSLPGKGKEAVAAAARCSAAHTAGASLLSLASFRDNG